ncbi:hypothetical protein [Methylosinus sp. LW4]|uniref:hypothetical protein n=1 Tax=Methylosinus sp. LW4 TaxID=136993 RepID=UPI000367A135|nr:hypothetical protein [Methylosinus sp. LW4]
MDIRQLAEYQLTTKGVVEAAAQFDQLEAAQKRAASGADVLTKQTEIQEKFVTRIGTKLEAYARSNDQTYKALANAERGERLLEAARKNGIEVTQAQIAAAEKARAKYNELAAAANDNSIANGMARAAGETARFNIALDRLQSFAWNNTSLSGNTIDRVVLPIRSLGAAIGGLPAIAVAAGVAIEAALVLIGHHAQQTLAELQDVSRQSGLGVNQIAGAQIVGARSGLTQDQTRSALTNAGKEYESYRRNEGGVKDTLDKVDEGFLKVADKAKSAGEFIDIIGEKIRALPREEGLDLSKKLFGEDAGDKLFANIQSGALSMRALGDEADRAGTLNEALAKHAEEVQRQIDEAAQVAKTKLLVALQDLDDPMSRLQRGWWNIVGIIAEAAGQAGRMRDILANGEVGKWAGLHAAGGTSFEDAFGKYRRKDAVVGAEEYGPPMPKGAPTTSAGVSRARYAARDESGSGGGASGKSDADRAAERYEKITRELNNQIDLLRTQGDEHDRLALKIDIEKKQLELGTGATQAQKDHIAELVTQLDAAKKAQERLNEEAKKFNEAYSAAAGTISGALKDVLNGGKPGDALQKALQSIQGQLLDASLTGAGPYAKLLGLNGKDGAVGGLFGGLASALGLGGNQTTGTMNVQAGVVTVNGGIGAGAGGGGLLSGLTNWIGGLFGQNADGTDNWRGGPTWVGERGPELVNLPRGSSVTPNAQSLAYTRSLANDNRGGASASPVTVNLIKAPPGTDVKQSTDSRGGRRIDVVFDERIAAASGSPQGVAVNRGLYGLKPVITRR